MIRWGLCWRWLGGCLGVCWGWFGLVAVIRYTQSSKIRACPGTPVGKFDLKWILSSNTSSGSIANYTSWMIYQKGVRAYDCCYGEIQKHSWPWTIIANFHFLYTQFYWFVLKSHSVMKSQCRSHSKSIPTFSCISQWLLLKSWHKVNFSWVLKGNSWRGDFSVVHQYLHQVNNLVSCSLVLFFMCGSFSNFVVWEH